MKSSSTSLFAVLSSPGSLSSVLFVRKKRLPFSSLRMFALSICATLEPLCYMYFLLPLPLFLPLFLLFLLPHFSYSSSPPLFNRQFSPLVFIYLFAPLLFSVFSTPPTSWTPRCSFAGSLSLARVTWSLSAASSSHQHIGSPSPFILCLISSYFHLFFLFIHHPPLLLTTFFFPSLLPGLSQFSDRS